MKTNNKSGIILTAAKADTTICEVFGELPTGLIPINGMPTIFFILNQFLENGIRDVFIGVDYKRDIIKKIVDLYFKTKLNIIYIYCDCSKGPGNSLLTILKSVKTEEVIINLGDTFINHLDYKKMRNTVLVSNDFLEEEKWATVKVNKKGMISSFIDKKKIRNKDLYAICGLYFLEDITILEKYISNDNNIQISEILEFYNKHIALNVSHTDQWLDFGHIDSYYISKKRLIQSREFNSLEFNDLLGVITKRSKNKEKFINEIKWQINLPKELKVLSPQVLDYSLNEDIFISMEYYSYPTLSEIWLFSELNEKIYFFIIDKLLKILELFKKIKADVSRDDYDEIYINKTKERVKKIENKTILNLMKYDTLTINSKEFKNWGILEESILKKCQELYNKDDNCLIHGDFCLSNILYDLRSGIIRLIDPRGIWGSSSNGDIKYDIAKLRHSICGNYDYIVSDLFTIYVEENKIDFDEYSFEKENIKRYFDKKITENFNLDQIKLIEGLLFLSMIPLHNDNENRQLAMYCNAIKLFNEIG